MELIHISAGSLYAIAVGLAGTFFGYKFFRIFLGLFGFMLGYGLADWILTLIEITDPTILLIVGIIGGIALGILAYQLYEWAVIIFGALLGVAVGTVILSFFDISQIVATIILVLAALIGGFVGSRVADTMIILATGIVGATQAIYGLAILVPGLPLGQPGLTRGADSVISLGVIAVLAAAGIYFQWQRRA